MRYSNSFHSSGTYAPQYQWLEEELPKANRIETPWLIVLMHTPWYSSYSYHYMEGETMRVMLDPWFVKHKVDVVFSGHVHAYERSASCSTFICSSFLYQVSNKMYNPHVELMPSHQANNLSRFPFGVSVLICNCSVETYTIFLWKPPASCRMSVVSLKLAEIIM